MNLGIEATESLLNFSGADWSLAQGCYFGGDIERILPSWRAIFPPTTATALKVIIEEPRRNGAEGETPGINAASFRSPGKDRDS